MDEEGGGGGGGGKPRTPPLPAPLNILPGDVAINE